MDDNCPVSPPDVFPFPFTPYDIQKEFMRNLFQAIEGKKIGIFESPTGTGKSMSIICGALTWLRDKDKVTRQALEKKLSEEKVDEKDVKSSVEDDEVGWISEFIQRKSNEDEKAAAKSLSDRIKSRDKKLKRIFEGTEGDYEGPTKKKMKFLHKTSKFKDETAFLLEQAQKELENREKSLRGEMVENDGNDRDILLEDYKSDDETEKRNTDEEDVEDKDDGVQKIYYCSRTHSQLTQFIREVQKSPFTQSKTEDAGEFSITVVPLASRHSLCINPSVRKLLSVQQMNDRCLDMQKNSKKDPEKDKENESKRKKKSTSTCPFKSGSNVENLSEKIIGKVQDIEEIVKAGKEITACPYYAARHAVSLAQLIVVPYQILLHASTRKASGIKLKDSVIIVDEAHNLVDTISNIHSIEVTCAQVHRAHNQLSQYAQKFSRRLKAENLMYVKKILFILKKLLIIMGINMDMSKQQVNSIDAKRSSCQLRTNLMTIHDFLFKSNLDNINLFKVLRYCERSMISKKLNGFVEKYECGSGSVAKQETSSLSKFLSNAKKSQVEPEPVTDSDSPPAVVMRSPLMHIENFLSSLTSANEDGRIAITTVEQKENQQAKIRETATLKFLLLNPAVHFKEIIQDCRSIIVAGGTMQPSSSFVDQLLTPLGVSKERIFEFLCGHVIKNDQLLPIVLNQGPGRVEFEFTFEKRKSLKLIDELGRTLCNLCNIVPGGVVCFFPSYDYEKVVYSRWLETDIVKRIEIKKKIFREPKKSSQVDKVLQEYSACIQRSKPVNSTATGALLLSVVGGKMSEGINFSDDLGRCVVMVGLPYPNLYSAELKEKMAYLDANMPKVGSKSAGKSYYENLCMKAVNQSIGRAIRHRNDHACIVLADRRYARPDIKSQLPGWIADKLHLADGFANAFGAVRKFFTEKRKSC